MSTVSSNIFLTFLGFIRFLIDFISETVFSLLYKGKHEPLPAIKDECLLESAISLAAKIRRQEIRSIDVVKAYIRRIRDVQPIVNAVVDERFAEAIEEAGLADNLIASGVRSEEELANEMPLLGVPISVKEAIAVKGCLFTVGLHARKGLRADFDSDAVTLLKKAGAIPLAMTITPELCFWWESYNSLYGRACNPYDTTRTVGGSSGGEGCIIASAGSMLGVANDVGGSIRIPAFFNGVFGHKPSRGVVSNYGQYPTAAPALQTYLMTGPLCRYASDLLPVMKILSDNHKKLKLDEPVALPKLKLYYMENDGGNVLVSPVNPEITAAMRKVLDYFQNTHGIVAEKKHLPLMRDAFEMWANILTTSDMQPVAVEMTGRKGEANLIIEWFKWFVGTSVHIVPVLFSAFFNKLMAVRDIKKSVVFYQKCSELQNQFDEMLGDDGIFLYPTNPDLALFHGQALTKPFNIGYTTVFNLLGLPVSQCPLGLSKNKLPIGIQVVAGLNMDRLTIAVAEELECAFGGWVNPSLVEPNST